MQVSPLHLHKRVSAALENEPLRDALRQVKGNFIGKRAKAVAAFNQSAEFEALRDYGRQVRNEAIAAMPTLLQQFCEQAERAGTTVLWAKDGERACELIGEIARRHEVKMAVKSKSMASEEIDLNDALSAAGVEVVETDLGEFIIQLAGERPSHIVAPAVHKTRAEVSRLFEQHLGVHTQDINELTLAARAYLRDKFLNADMGISGANFLLADTGSALIVTNEGNGRLTTTLPRVHVTIAGIDKIVARAADMPYMLTLLTHSATGQRLSNYVSITSGARRLAAAGGEHTYVVLLDNGRSDLRDSEYRDMLRCIRCGACMNHCPVYHSIGGHAYGSVYMGPMGQVLTPALKGIAHAPDMPYAATLCGACEVVCPVKIPLPRLMRRLRRERVRKRLSSRADRWFMRLWHFCAMRPRLYARVTALAVRLGALWGGRRRRIRYVPGLREWCDGRDLPAPPGQTYRQLWRAGRGEEQR